MSLSQRVSSFESLSLYPERGRSLSDGGSPSSRDRKLSFSPLPGAWDPPPALAEHVHPISAFEIPRSTRICKFSLTRGSLFPLLLESYFPFLRSLLTRITI